MSPPNIPDHPDIRRCLCTGYAHPLKAAPTCPVCGKEVDEYLKDKYGDIVGCENCVKPYDAWEENDDTV